MSDFDHDLARQFAVALSALIRLPVPKELSQKVATVLFSAAPPGTVTLERLGADAAAEDIDIIHLEFDSGREAAGPSNIVMCEYRSHLWHLWPRCQVWEADDGLPLTTPVGQDFGFAFNGAGLIHVTDLPAERRRGVRRARSRLQAIRRQVYRQLRGERALH